VTSGPGVPSASEDAVSVAPSSKKAKKEKVEKKPKKG
jgi:hypothetical protein